MLVATVTRDRRYHGTRDRLRRQGRWRWDFGLTWLFAVDAGFNYLFRLHFCDSTAKAAALPRFSIYIGNKTTLET
ncbi:hypothetical protein IGI04_040085 [Brassica rapa subsp. trilocularis]|uniref:Uncharacterized protein n=1 Tax=Brassica rapa subsp. trilocularis TaxID=1813537 RepID=A0ABQ7KLU3_BRACM|nr:hypothetical protein IGI04_040085 [Brassica rapa subsp. trilocularis]